jgi:hypothetical protein
VYSTSLGGSTPCYSSLLVPLSAPTGSLTSSNIPDAPTSTVTIVNYVFTYQFTLQPSTPSGIGTTAKIGIGVGVGLGVGLGALLVSGYFFLRRKPRPENPQGSPKRMPEQLDSVPVQELYTLERPIELQETIYEMGSDGAKVLQITH